MRCLALVLVPLAVSACASGPAAVVGADHPARPTAGGRAAPVQEVWLSPVAPPALPAALRTGATAGMDHGAMAGMDHGAMAGMDRGADASDPGARALDAYLAVQEALAADRTDGVADHAHAFLAAFDALTSAAPPDDPHRWHARAGEARAVADAARALAEAPTLAAARDAFARLSAPYLQLVDAVGAPAGADVQRMTCGMVAGAPQGGVWLQRTGPTRNPYVGSAMPTCGSGQPPPAAGAPDADHAGH